MTLTVDIINDIRAFSERYLKVVDKQGRLVPLKLYPFQLHYLTNRTSRNITVKARQIGHSTLIFAKNFHYAVTNPYTEIACLAHKDEAKELLFKIVTRFYRHFPFNLDTDCDRTDMIKFKKLDSTIYIGTAGAKVFGRADTIHRAHLTEMAHWAPDKIKEILTGVTGAMPATAEIDIESTPKGRSGDFYEWYQAAKNNEIPYKTFFYPWWWCDDYRMNLNNPLLVEEDIRNPLSTEEKDLMEKQKLDFDQILWRRYKIRELNKIQEGLFFQEYPEDDITCWLSQQISVFDQIALGEMMKEIRPPIVIDDYVKYWKRPMGARPYCIAADVGEGLPHGDFSAAVVLDPKSCEVVATYRTKLPQDVFTDRLIRLGKQYNYALIAPERNTGHGILQILLREGYPNLYYHRDYDELGKVSPRPGFPINVKTRSGLIDSFKSAIANRYVVIYDADLVDECMNWQYINGRADHPDGSHDDLLIATMIAFQIRDQASLIEKETGYEVIRYI